MRVLGIESSCDECSLAIVDDGINCIGMETYSQISQHAQYKGVVPELASRLHVQYVSHLYERLLKNSGLAESSIDGIAVTNRPGLSGSLMVGLAFAKALSLRLGKPFVAVDHIEAHFYSARVMLREAQLLAKTKVQTERNAPVQKIYPYLGVVVSGGHTIFAVVSNYDDIEIKGTTIDDACGEVFDKVARELGFRYPGGADLDALARHGNSDAAYFPIYCAKQHGYNVSYSGLKTAVIHHRKKYWNKEYKESNENIAAAFSKAAVSMITDRVHMMHECTGIDSVYFGGGVACNSFLRAHFNDKKSLLEVIFPPPLLCADNGAMIAGLGYWYLITDRCSSYDVTAQSRNLQYRNRN